MLVRAAGLVTGLVVAMVPSMLSAAEIVVRPGDPLLSGAAQITNVEPRNGSGSVDLSTGPYLVYEYGSSTGLSFGRWGDLTGLTFEALVNGPNTWRPDLAIRLGYYGDPSSSFVTATLRQQQAGQWVLHDVFGDWVLQSADGNPPPPDFSAIDPNTPVTGIHLRSNAWAGPYMGYGDQVTLRFGEATTTFNFEPAAVPEPRLWLLLLSAPPCLALWRGRHRSH